MKSEKTGFCFALSTVFCAALVPDPVARSIFKGGPEPPPDCLKNLALSRFVTQRATQQQIYYCELNLDETQGTWLGGFLRPGDSLPLSTDYHGIDALPTADSSTFLCGMFIEPSYEVRIKKPMGCAAGTGHGGLNSFTGLPINRNKNPYLKPRYFEYTECIRPADMARGIISIREQLAEEMTFDLSTFLNENSVIMDNLENSRINKPEDFMPEWQHLTEMGKEASPFRMANYELLSVLITREAVSTTCEVLERSAKRAEVKRALWLKRFAESYFDALSGHNQWDQSIPTVAHRFLCDIQQASPQVCMYLLEARSSLASDWLNNLNDCVQEEHLLWQRWHAERRTLFLDQ